MNRNVKSFEQTAFLSQRCAVSECLVFEVLSFCLDIDPQSFRQSPLVYCPVDDTLFEVIPDLCEVAGSKPIQNFLP